MKPLEGRHLTLEGGREESSRTLEPEAPKLLGPTVSYLTSTL